MKLRLRSSSSLAFSLVELLVVVAIFITITSVVLINQNRFSSNIAIQNLAYQIALSIRQAQVYGLSVRGSGGGASTFDTSFGVHFDSASSTQFIFYADNNEDKKYVPTDDTLISTFTLSTGSISDVCTYGSITNCYSSTGQKKISSADVTFKRPKPEAIIVDNRSQVGDPDKSKITITIQSILKDRTQIITVTQAGQIYVN